LNYIGIDFSKHSSADELKEYVKMLTVMAVDLLMHNYTRIMLFL